MAVSFIKDYNEDYTEDDGEGNDDDYSKTEDKDSGTWSDQNELNLKSVIEKQSLQRQTWSSPTRGSELLSACNRAISGYQRTIGNVKIAGIGFGHR